MKKKWNNPEFKNLKIENTMENVQPVMPADARCVEGPWFTSVGPKWNNSNPGYWECASVGQGNGNDPQIPRCKYFYGHDKCTAGQSVGES